MSGKAAAMQFDFKKVFIPSSHSAGGNVQFSIFREAGTRAETISKTAEVLVEHFVGIGAILAFGGFKKSAALIRSSIPAAASVQTRSGDLGEVLATEYIRHHTVFDVPFNRLRWKDDRSMPMRGNDVIGLDRSSNPPTLLKAESKSRNVLTSTVLAEAAAGLDAHNGRPNPSSIGFIVKRLLELDRLAEAAEYNAILAKGSKAKNPVAHHIFVFTGNEPASLLAAIALPARPGVIRTSAAIVVTDHPDFVAAVFEAAIGK